MTSFAAVFGTENHVSIAQESARAALIFFYGLLLLRLSGRRTFAHWSAVDVIIFIILGSALGRTMTGSAPLPGTMAATAVLTALHVLIGHATTRSHALALVLDGGPIPLMENGRLDVAMCRRHMISQADVAEALRQEGLDGMQDLARVKRMVLEPSGKISVVKTAPG